MVVSGVTSIRFQQKNKKWYTKGVRSSCTRTHNQLTGVFCKEDGGGGVLSYATGEYPPCISTRTVCPVGAPLAEGSVEREYCVFATHIGN